MPPPLTAEFPEMVELVTVTVELVPLPPPMPMPPLKIPPPKPPAILPEMVELVTVREPLFKKAPPLPELSTLSLLTSSVRKVFAPETLTPEMLRLPF